MIPPPLVKGGQGRSVSELRASASWLTAIILLALAGLGALALLN